MNDIFNTDVPLKTETPAFAKHLLPAVPSSEVYLEDCVKALKRFSDNYFDLAIVDPPYGIGYDGAKQTSGSHGGRKAHDFKGWDSKIPDKEYFDELYRVSKNQIIWGGNYFPLPPTRCFIVWDKQISKDFSLAMAELAWTSFDKLAKICKMPTPKDGKIHPTQKPIKLYKWLLHNYTNENDLILDTHLGSGSSRIAAYKGGFNFVGFEIDQEYYEKQEKRFNDFKSQLRLF
jgi:site-specific DNA-methyltransferase (adenine-specific)